MMTLHTTLVLSVLMAAIGVSPSTNAAEFTYSNLLHARMKLDSDFNFGLHVDAYMQLYRPLVYKHSLNDEFKIHQQRKETISIMKKAVQKVSLDEMYSLPTVVRVGAYDFSEHQFYVSQASPSHYWYKSRQYCRNCDLPKSFSVFFGNYDIMRKLPMTERQANEFVNRRKDRYGKVDRRLYATIKFRLVALKDSKDQLIAEIQSAKFFEDRQRTRLIHHVLKPADAKPVTKEKADERMPSRERSALESEAELHLIGGL